MRALRFVGATRLKALNSVCAIIANNLFLFFRRSLLRRRQLFLQD
jgi:hypothetical protein